MTSETDLASETPAERKRRAGRIVRGLEKAYPGVDCALHHETPFQLTVATILSAQCTDERVNAVTPNLFRKYPDAEALAAASQEDVEQVIRSLGFFRAKATNLLGMARKLIDEFDGEIPDNLPDLVSLPGIGRKTANVVLGVAFGRATGVVVDTHVKRISNLLGLTESKNPEIIERDLMKLLPKTKWIAFSHQLIHHGRGICIARRPKCPECPLLRQCPRVGLPPLT